MGFADEMGQYDDQAEVDKASRPGLLPDGTYKGENAGVITEARIEERDGRWSWVIKLEARYIEQTDAGPVERNGSVRKFQNLDNEVGRAIAAQDMFTLGYTGRLSGLEEACMLGTFDDLIVEFVVKTKPGTDRDFLNVYINRCLGKSKGDRVIATNDPDFAASAVAADDDIPF